MTKHLAELVAGSRVGSHGRCSCGRIIQHTFTARRGNAGQAEQGRLLADPTNWGWRHVSNPSSSMIPAAVREAAHG